MTEKEALEFWTREWENHLDQMNEKKLTSEEIEDLEKSTGINDPEA